MTFEMSAAGQVPTLPNHRRRWAAVIVLALFVISSSGCSVRQYTVDMVGDMLAEGGSVYESDDDIVLVGEALPFSLKLLETLLQESPRNRGLLIAASRGFVLYAYAYVQHQAEMEALEDIQSAKVHRDRARRLYLRAHGYAVRGLEVSYPGIGVRLIEDPRAAVEAVGGGDGERDVSMLYWSAASLGLAISVSKHDPSLLGRLPEVEAMLDRAMEIDESWDSGTLHEFAIVWAGARRGAARPKTVREHYERALALSGGTRASLFVAYAEAVSVPAQDRAGFVELLNKALAVDVDEEPSHRLVNTIAQRRAAWLLARTDELILE